MVEVVGPWGAGTSLVCAILEAHGCYFGDSVAPEHGSAAHGRNPLGLYEQRHLWQAHGRNVPQTRREELTCQGFADLITEAEARDRRPACKMPGILFAPWAWPLWYSVADTVVYVRRPTKDYLADPIWQAELADPSTNLARLEEAYEWFDRLLVEHKPETRRTTVYYEDLYHDTQHAIEQLTAGIGAVFNPSSVQLVDTTHPRQPPPRANTATSLVT